MVAVAVGVLGVGVAAVLDGFGCAVLVAVANAPGVGVGGSRKTVIVTAGLGVAEPLISASLFTSSIKASASIAGSFSGFQIR